MQNPSSFQSEYEPFFTKIFWPHGGQSPQFNNCVLTGYLNGPANQFPKKMKIRGNAGQKARVLATDCGKIVCEIGLTVHEHNGKVFILEYANGEHGLFDFQTFLACQRVISMKRSQDQLTELLKAPRKAKLSKAEKRAFGAVETVASVRTAEISEVKEENVVNVVNAVSPKKARKSIVDEHC